MNLRGRTQNYSKTDQNGGPVFEGMAEQHVAISETRPPSPEGSVPGAVAVDRIKPT